MTQVAASPWTCPTCGITRATAFCDTCGERPIQPRDLTLRGLLTMLYRAFSPVDGRLLRSFVALLRHPGRLTVAFQKGQRKPYVGPFQLFIIANVFFFAVQSAGSMRIFTQPLAQRVDAEELWGPFSKALTDAHLAETGRTFAQYAPLFDQAVSVNAKSFIGLMVPPFALLLALVFARRSQPLAVNIMFSLHFYAFLLLLFCVPLAVMEASALLGGPAVAPPMVDDVMSTVLLLSCALYIYTAIGPVYGARGVLRVLQAMILAIAVAGIFLIYRVTLLPVTLYTT
jgi:hypothetical protein